MSRAVVVVATLLLVPGSAASAPLLLQAFDPERFSREDKAIIELALTFTRDFHGEADGLWDSAGERALTDFVVRSFPSYSADPVLLNAHVAPLAWLVGRRWTEEDWRDVDVLGGAVSFFAPWALFPEGPVFRGETVMFETASGDLTVVASVSTRAQAAGLHLRYEAALTDASPRVEIRRETSRFVTAGFTTRGDAFHLLSAPVGGRWVNLAILASPYRLELLSAIRATVSIGAPSPRYEFAATSLLTTLKHLSAAIASSADGDHALPRIGGTGTAWFVSDRRLVTAAHVVNGCARVSTADGQELSVEAVDPGLDLALLSSSTRSRAWLPLATAAEPELGSRVRVLSYPFFNFVSTSLVVTSGDIASLRGVFDDPSRFVISAPIQPGSSGGPGLDDAGAVVTTVLSRLAHREVLRVTGGVSENFNFGVSTAELRRWLLRVGVTPSDPSPLSFARDGIPAPVARAVIPILCLTGGVR